MSPHVNNFVTDLVQMAKAMEELPIAQERMRELEAHVDHANETIAAREISIISYKRELDELHAKLRDAEVARDDAELRFLEADDQMGKVAKAFQVALEAMDHADKVIVTAEEVLHPIPPVPEPHAKFDDGGPYNEPSPTVDTGQSSGPQAMGQSDLNPTATIAQETPVEQTTGASMQEDVSLTDARPFIGRRYIDVHGFVSRSDWLAGGGTEANYDWRPGDDTRYLP